ncbi:MAG: hypothetical protein ACK4Z7_10670 [Novosphingobium sp.]
MFHARLPFRTGPGLVLFAVILLPQTQAVAADPLARCRAIADPGARLACYDAIAPSAEQGSAAMAADASSPAAASADTFGMPQRIRPEDRPSISATVVATDFDPKLGFATLTLDNGQVWQTSSNGTLAGRLREGQAVTIRDGGMFGYRLRIEGRTGFQAVTRVK